jgi:hypothetical protein
MRALTVAVMTAIAISLTWQATDAAPSSKQQQHARSIGDCVRLANTRGWSRAGEKGRLPFIRRCMQGKSV